MFGGTLGSVNDKGRHLHHHHHHHHHHPHLISPPSSQSSPSSYSTIFIITSPCHHCLHFLKKMQPTAFDPSTGKASHLSISLRAGWEFLSWGQARKLLRNCSSSGTSCSFLKSCLTDPPSEETNVARAGRVPTGSRDVRQHLLCPPSELTAASKLSE